MSNETEMCVLHTELSFNIDVNSADIATNDTNDTSAIGMPDETVIEAKKKLIFRCGKSSLTLHANGKVLVEGLEIFLNGERRTQVCGGQISLN
jgi:hypothetical protein